MLPYIAYMDPMGYYNISIYHIHIYIYVLYIYVLYTYIYMYYIYIYPKKGRSNLPLALL